MAKSCIPGYDKALEYERKLREEACMSGESAICGIKINQVTPFLLARLFRMGTPYITGEEYSRAHTLRFIWAMSPDFCVDAEKREAFFFDSAKRLLEVGFDSADADIEEFLDATFLDAPQVGVESTPYVSSPAWLVHKMMKEYPQITEAAALHMPIRRIYQYIRCCELAKGAIVYNPSDKIKADWTADLQEKWKQSRGNN